VNIWITWKGGELVIQPDTMSNLFREALKFEVNRLVEAGVRKANIEIELITYVKGLLYQEGN
jgi:hypothetical protein